MPVAAAIPLAGKLLPFLAKAGSAKALPWVLRGAGALGGATPGLMRGDLGSAVVGGGLGAASTLGLGGLTGKAATGLGGLAMRGLGKAGLATIPGMAAAVPALAGAAVPVAAGLGIGRLTGGNVGAPAAQTVAAGGGGLMNTAAGIYGYGGPSGEAMYDPGTRSGGAYIGGGGAVPNVGQFGGVDPYGNPIDVLNPAGLDAGRRLRMQKDAEAQRDAMNVLLPTLRKYSEQAKKDEFERSMAGAGIKQNILTNAALTQEMQRAGLDMGKTASQQAGSALTQKFTY